jgi:hypothetical protein
MMVPPDKEHIEALRKSTELGYFQPIIKNKRTGKTLIGKHREAADPNWPVQYVDVDEFTEKLIVITGNLQRTVSRQETEHYLLDIAKTLEARGVPKNHVCAEISKLPGVCARWMREIFDNYPEYKMESKARPQICGVTSAKSSLEQVDEDAKEMKTALSNLGTPSADGNNIGLPFPDCLCKTCPRLHQCY